MYSSAVKTDALDERIAAWRGLIRDCVARLYGEAYDADRLTDELLDLAAHAYARRPDALKALDNRRLANPDWFQSSEMLGYTAYVDRFGGTLKGVGERIGHLEALGVTYLHLLPLMDMRPELNDGGFAVQSYDRPDPRFGTMEDLSDLATSLREAGISLCIDFVCNHTADTHDWAMRARAGDPAYKAFYHTYPDRQIPDQFEETVPEIFAETAPGNFTQVPETGDWVWTTFYPYQWDLNYSNPEVLKAMVSAMLNLANQGVEVLRLDAAPFLWKRLGTECQSLPEVHAILKIFRALSGIAAPSLLLKAEAIVPSDELIKYVGGGEDDRPECQLAYNTVLMTLLWSALAHGSVDRLIWVMEKMPPMPDDAAWLAYVRCHDDIGWAPLLGEVEMDPQQPWLDYVRQAANKLSGRGEGAFGEGRAFQTGSDPEAVHGTSGTAASLCGFGRALRAGDMEGVRVATDRMVLLYSTVLAIGGIPLISMGDEIALLNDEHFASRPSYDGDSRWIHRGPMDWNLAAAADETPAGQVRLRLRQARDLRRKTAPSSGANTFLDLGNDAVLGFTREGEGRRMLFLANYSETSQTVSLPQGAWAEAATDRRVSGPLTLPGLGTAWLHLA